MMRKYFALMMSLLVALASAAQSADQEKEVQQAARHFFAVLASRDAVAIKNASAANIQLIEYGTLWNMDTLLQKVVKTKVPADFSRVDSLVFLSTEVMGTSALATYHLYSRITRNGSLTHLHWIESINLIYDKDRWKVLFLHSTLLNRNNP